MPSFLPCTAQKDTTKLLNSLITSTSQKLLEPPPLITWSSRFTATKTFDVFRSMKAHSHLRPSNVTYRFLTKALIDAGRIDEAYELLLDMAYANSVVYNNLIAAYLQLGNLDKANQLFDDLKMRCLVYDSVVNATFMEWFFKEGREKEAMESYDSLLNHKFRMRPETCNALLEVLLKHGKKTEAWDFVL